MLQVTQATIDELDVQRWNDLLMKSEVCDAFQTYEWAQLLRNSLGVQPHFLMVKDGRETVGGVLLLQKKIFKALNCYEVRGGPLHVGTRKMSVMRSILKAFRKRKKGTFYSLFIPSPLINRDFKEVFKIEGYHPIPFRTIIIDLRRPLEEIWLSLDKNSRRMVGRAERFGVDVQIASSWEEWEEFYDLHVLHSRKKQYSIYPRSYFEELFRLSHKNLSSLFVATYGKRIIAGTVLLLHGKNMVYLENASSEAFLKYNPNNLVQWRTIEWATKNGLATYDLYGLPGEETKYLRGIYDYKKRWNGYVQWYYYYLDNRVLSSGIHLILSSFSAWKLFKALKNYGMIQR